MGSKHAGYGPTGVVVRFLSLILFSLTGCGADGEEAQTISTNPSPAGATVSLAWDGVNDSSVIGYYIHYGKQSPNWPGSCAYDQEQFVSSTQGTVTDLERGLTYYFAVSAYNGLESNCSNEVFAHTPLIDCCPSWGWRGEVVSLRYARTLCLWSDINILLATPAAMITGKGLC
ncbi:MAG: fibronectin type III domain-containing protein [Nitrospira sp.]|nr:fibronectin type III domain-containing protein [Nitrospira sp.]